MTDDLVKRLLEPVIDPFFGPLIEPIKKEAADRIDQLQAALREISYIHDGNPSPAMAGMPDVDYARFVLGQARRVARAALGEKLDV